MSRSDFEDAVRDALDEIPGELAAQMDNVVVLVEDDPPADDPDLLGVYEGVPLTERDDSWAMGALPDRITIFRRPTLTMCETRAEVVVRPRVVEPVLLGALPLLACHRPPVLWQKHDPEPNSA